MRLQFIANRLFLYSVAGLLAAGPAAMDAQTRPRIGATRPASLQTTEEAKELVKALRSIEGRTEAGMNYREMNREMGDLTIAVNAFREVLEARRETKLLRQIDEMFAPYKDAQTFWNWCVVAEICAYGFVNVNVESEGATFTRQVLARYPSLNAQAKDGGVFSDHPQAGPGTVFRGALVGALWQIGGGRAKALREALVRP